MLSKVKEFFLDLLLKQFFNTDKEFLFPIWKKNRKIILLNGLEEKERVLF